MKTLAEYLRATDRSPDDLYRDIAPAYMGGAANIDSRFRVLYDWEKVVAILGSEEAARAIAVCDGSCPGCREGGGAGCDAVALFHPTVR